MALSLDAVGQPSDNVRVAHIWWYKYRLPSGWCSYPDSIAEDKAGTEQKEEAHDVDRQLVDPSN